MKLLPEVLNNLRAHLQAMATDAMDGKASSKSYVTAAGDGFVVFFVPPDDARVVMALLDRLHGAPADLLGRGEIRPDPKRN